MKNPLKKKSTRIIQIIYNNYNAVHGLGDDGRVYGWRASNSSWYFYGEIDDQIWEELK